MYPQSEPGFEPEFAPGTPQPMQAPQAKEREVTLGPVLLGGIGAGLLVLCCICFLVGYEVGNHGAPLPGLKGAAVDNKGPSAAQLLAQIKPAATSAVPKTFSPAATATKAAPPAPKETALPAAEPSPAYQLRTAAQTVTPNPSAITVPTPSGTSTGPVVRPALAIATAPPVAGSWRVQIAAVEHSDDADVLVSALRQRGYSVSVRHGLTDDLLHVQVGPFPTQGDAEAMRQKLLNDGYNAVLLH